MGVVDLGVGALIFGEGRVGVGRSPGEFLEFLVL